jgi:hypothetical protein
MPPGPPGMTGGVAPPPAAGNIEETWLNAGAAEAQPCGTDNMPSEAARPTPAVTAFPIPTEPNMLVPEPTPPPSVDPKAWSWLLKVLAAGLTEFMSPLVELSIVMAEVPIDAPDPAPDATPVPDVRAVDEELRLDTDDSGKVDDEDDVVVAVDIAAADNALGAAAELSGADTAEVSGVDTAEASGVDTAEASGVDTAELSGVDTAEASGVDTAELSGVDTAEASGATVCALVPADVAEACPTAAACPANPAGLVVCGAGVNGVNVDAVCEAP